MPIIRNNDEYDAALVHLDELENADASDIDSGQYIALADAIAEYEESAIEAWVA
jgi:hypothetical protein